MKVLLRRNFFGPDDQLYLRGASSSVPVEIPDHLEAHLPSDAVIVEDDGASRSPARPEKLMPVKREPQKKLAALEPVESPRSLGMANAEAEEVAHAQANAEIEEQARRRAALQAEIEAEQRKNKKGK